MRKKAEKYNKGINSAIFCGMNVFHYVAKSPMKDWTDARCSSHLNSKDVKFKNIQIDIIW